MFLTFFLYVSKVSSQCLTVPVPLEKIFQESDLVVEGQMIYKNSFFGKDNNIYSKYAIVPYTIYKGLNADTFYAISLGGRIDLRITEAYPSDGFNEERGIFFLKNDQANNSGSSQMTYRTVAGRQSCYYTDGISINDLYNRYPDYNLFINTIVTISGEKRILRQFQQPTNNSKRATPVINSITPSYRTAGTDSTITIIGSNFNSSRGTGNVGFRNANDGGSSFINPLASEYLTWNDTMIVVKVPTQAGTGTIRVTNSDPANVTSSTSLYIPYNLINVTYNPGSGAEHYSSRLQGLNSGNSMIYNFTVSFNDSVEAKRDFVNSLESWRCKTLVNFDTATGTSNKTSAANDTFNLVMWDYVSTLGLGTLGVAITNFSGCSVSGVISFFVIDLDMVFNDVPFSGYTWEYGSGTPSGSQFDFESVAVHELEHTHQLGHVNDANKVMHYSLSNGIKKSSISTMDSFGGKFIMNLSGSSVCSNTAMSPLNSTSCSYVALASDRIHLNGIRIEKDVRLNWMAINEFNQSHYEIARSFDGVNFTRIAKQKSNNNSRYSEYEYVDQNLTNPVVYYRIIGIDNDLSAQSSNIISIDYSSSHFDFWAEKIENGSYKLQLPEEFSNSGIPKIYDTNGKELKCHKNNGEWMFEIKSSGIYYIIFETESKIYWKKLAVLY